MGKLMDPIVAQAMGLSARRHAQANFSREAFGRRLDSYVRQLAAAGVAGKRGSGGAATTVARSSAAPLKQSKGRSAHTSR